MPFNKLNSFTKRVSDLPDKPNGTMTAAEVKAQFDSSPEELRVALNTLIDVLISVTADSGAKNIGVNEINGVTGVNIQEILEYLASNKLDILADFKGTWRGLLPQDFSGGQQAVDIADHKADYVKHPGAATTTNVGNAYSITLNPVPSSYLDKMGVVITINSDSTGASTLNVNGLGAKALKGATGIDITNLKANGIYTFRYNATTGNFILQGASELQASNVTTTGGSNVQSEIDSLKSSVSSGKGNVETAITGKGGTVSKGGSVATFSELVTGVNTILIPKTIDLLVKQVAILSSGITYMNDIVYNDESDGIAIGRYNNSTGGDYRVFGYNRSLAQHFSSINFGQTINSVERDANYFYCSPNGQLYKYSIPATLGGSPVLQWQLTGLGYNYSKIMVINNKLYCLNGTDGKTLHVRDISNGTLLDTITLPNILSATEGIIPDQAGFLYVYDSTTKDCYKYNLTTKSIVWTVTSLSVSGSGVIGMAQSTNYVYTLGTSGYITQIKKSDGSILGTRNTLNSLGVTDIRMASDQFDNMFMWQNAVNSIRYTGKESFVGNFNGSTYSNAMPSIFRGKKKPFCLNPNNNLQTIDYYYPI